MKMQLGKFVTQGESIVTIGDQAYETLQKRLRDLSRS